MRISWNGSIGGILVVECKVSNMIRVASTMSATARRGCLTCNTGAAQVDQLGGAKFACPGQDNVAFLHVAVGYARCVKASQCLRDGAQQRLDLQSAPAAAGLRAFANQVLHRTTTQQAARQRVNYIRV